MIKFFFHWTKVNYLLCTHSLAELQEEKVWSRDSLQVDLFRWVVRDCRPPNKFSPPVRLLWAGKPFQAIDDDDELFSLLLRERPFSPSPQRVCWVELENCEIQSSRSNTKALWKLSCEMNKMLRAGRDEDTRNCQKKIEKTSPTALSRSGLCVKLVWNCENETFSKNLQAFRHRIRSSSTVEVLAEMVYISRDYEKLKVECVRCRSGWDPLSVCG